MYDKLRKQHPSYEKIWSYEKIDGLSADEKQSANRIMISSGVPKDIKEIGLTLSKEDWPILDCIDITSSLDTVKKITLDIPTVEVLFCHSKSVKKLDISKCPNLEVIDISNSSISELDLSNCSPELEHISCRATPMKSLDVSPFRFLKSLTISDTKIEHINLSHNVELEQLFCDNTPLRGLDLSHDRTLKIFGAKGLRKSVQPDRLFLNPATSGRGVFWDLSMLEIITGVFNTMMRDEKNPKILKILQKKRKVMIDFAKKIEELEDEHKNVALDWNFYMAKLSFCSQRSITGSR